MSVTILTDLVAWFPMRSLSNGAYLFIMVMDQMALYFIIRFVFYHTPRYILGGLILLAADPSSVFSALYAWTFEPAYSRVYVASVALTVAAGQIIMLLSPVLVLALSASTMIFISFLHAKVNAFFLRLRAWGWDVITRGVDQQTALHMLSSMLLHLLTIYAVPASTLSCFVLIVADMLIRAVVVPLLFVEPVLLNPDCHGGSRSAALPASRWQAILLAADRGGNFSADARCSVCFETIHKKSSMASGLGVPCETSPEFPLWRDTASKLRDEHAPLQRWMELKSEVVLTSCGHVFHASCLAGWEVALAMRLQLPPTSCAVCRAPYASMRVQLPRRHVVVRKVPAWRERGRGERGGKGFLDARATDTDLLPAEAAPPPAARAFPPAALSAAARPTYSPFARRGFPPQDIELVMTAAAVSKWRAVRALQKHNGDMMNAIADLTTDEQ